jgi:hypothetical protein
MDCYVLAARIYISIRKHNMVQPVGVWCGCGKYPYKIKIDTFECVLLFCRKKKEFAFNNEFFVFFNTNPYMRVFI